MAQYPRVTIHLEMTSTDLRSEYDTAVDNPLWEMDVLGKEFISTLLRDAFNERSGVEVNISRLDVSHDLDEREPAVAA